MVSPAPSKPNAYQRILPRIETCEQLPGIANPPAPPCSPPAGGQIGKCPQGARVWLRLRRTSVEPRGARGAASGEQREGGEEQLDQHLHLSFPLNWLFFAYLPEGGGESKNRG